MVVSYGVVGYRRRYEITRNKFCSLMYQLIEGMLAICPWLSPDNRSCLVVNTVAIPVHIFAVALHISLLEISRKTVKILVVRQYSMTFSSKEIVVPNA